MDDWTPEQKEILKNNGRAAVRLAVAHARIEGLTKYAYVNDVIGTPDELEAMNPLLERAAEANEAAAEAMDALIKAHQQRLARGEVGSSKRPAPTIARPVDVREN